MTNPNEPTLTCSEVVERLATELACHFDCTACVHGERHDCCCCCRTTTEIRTIAIAILHSWRERRVQELEEALRYIAEKSPDDADVESWKWLARHFKAVSEVTLKLKPSHADELGGYLEWREQIRKGAKHESDL